MAGVVPLLHAHASRTLIFLCLTCTAGCGGKLENSAEQDSPGPMGQVGGSSGTGGSAAGAVGGTLPDCGGTVVESPKGLSFSGTLSSESGASVSASCSENQSPTPAQFFIVRGGEGLTADTYGSDFDTTLSVYDGLCSATELACNDDGAPGLSRASRLTLPRTPSGLVTLVVSGYGDASGTLRLHLGDASSCNSTVLSERTSAMVRDTTSGREDRYVSHCSTRISSPDVSYVFTPAFSGVYDIAVTESDFDPLIALVEEDCLGNEILCLDDRDGSKNPSVGHYLEAEKRYVIVVDSYGGTEGTFTLSISPSTSDSGYCCSASPTRASCTMQSIASCVCESWPTCCSEGWTEACLIAADSLGCGRDYRCDEPP